MKNKITHFAPKLTLFENLQFFFQKSDLINQYQTRRGTRLQMMFYSTLLEHSRIFKIRSKKVVSFLVKMGSSKY